MKPNAGGQNRKTKSTLKSIKNKINYNKNN